MRSRVAKRMWISELANWQRTSLRAPRIELPRDDDALDLRRPFVDLGDFGVAEQPLYRILLDVAVAAEDLNRFGRRPHRRLAGEELGHRAELADVLAAVLRRRGGVQQRPRRRHARRDVGQLELNRLKFFDQRSELFPLSGVRGGRAQRRLADP